MDDAELRGRLMAIEMLLTEALTTDGADARHRARIWLERFPDVLAGHAPGFGGPEVVNAAHEAMRDIWAKIIGLSDVADQVRAAQARRADTRLE